MRNSKWHRILSYFDSVFLCAPANEWVVNAPTDFRSVALCWLRLHPICAFHSRCVDRLQNVCGTHTHTRVILHRPTSEKGVPLQPNEFAITAHTCLFSLCLSTMRMDCFVAASSLSHRYRIHIFFSTRKALAQRRKNIVFPIRKSIDSAWTPFTHRHTSAASKIIVIIIVRIERNKCIA